MRFALGVEYDGTAFLGWQRLSQPGTDRSGQGRALPAHFREKSPLTDTAGVAWAM